jgi:uncharacterized protein (TIGR03437 family)
MRSLRRRHFTLALATVLLSVFCSLSAIAAEPAVFSGAGTTDATNALNAFRTAAGTNNGGGPAQTSGRREVSWDGVALDGTDNGGNTTVIVQGKITGIPINRFQNRGMLFKEVTAVSNDGFLSANPTVTGQFPAFSPANTFAAIGGNQIEVNFVLVSAATTTPVPASTRGFGVIFVDVEQANSSSIEYFNGSTSLGKYFVPPGPSGQPEFLGVLFSSPIVTRAVITAGTARLFSFSNNTVTAGPAEDLAQNVDLAATDDFIIAEPVNSILASFSGAGAADATNARDAFRAAAGTDNGGGPAQTAGRREITWDGVRLDGADNNGNTTLIVRDKITGIPINRFQNRGVLFKEVTAVSGDGFLSANPTVTGQFPAFSPANTFAAIGGNQIEVNFVLVSAATTTPVPASTRGFGVIFVDVESANTSSIEYFNGSVSLGKFFVPPGQSGQHQFLGVLFNSPVVTRAVITAGTARLFSFSNNTVTAGPAENLAGGVDLAATDDFLVAEPVTTLASVSAASFAGTEMAAESIVAAFGSNLATDTQVGSTLPLPTTLAGTSVRVKDSAGAERLAPLFFVAPGQINKQVPPGTAEGNALITVTNGNGGVSTGQAQIVKVAPGLFSANSNGQGAAAAVVYRLRADGTAVYEPVATFDATQQRFVPTPIDLGPESDLVYLILYGTGVRGRSSLQTVTARIGGADAPVLYADALGGFVGLDQINVRLLRSLIGRGEVDVVLTVEGKNSNTLRINVK